MNLNKFVSELQRRHVFKATIAYLAVAWVIIQIASIVLPTFQAPEQALRGVIYILFAGLPFWIGFSWVYDLTPSGFRKTQELQDDLATPELTNRRLNKVIIVSLLIVVTLLIVNQFFINIIPVSSVGDNSTMLSSRNHTSSIAVLAFKDLSPQKDQEFFSDGISEGILSLLTKIPNLKVISSASSFHYKNKNEAFSKIAIDLNVKYILDGSVRKADSLLRITTKLIDAKDGSQIWDRTFDRRFEDIFQIQDEIAHSVAQQLKLTLSDESLNSSRINFEAYQLFLESSYYFNEFTPQSMIKADALIRNSILIDSSYAPSWILLGKIADRRSRNFDQISNEEGIFISANSAKRALKIDTDDAEAYAFLANIESLQGNYENAKTLMSKARQLEPSNPSVISMGSSVYFYLGNIQESIKLEHEALAIDPLQPRHLFSLGLNYYFIHEYDNALDYLSQYNYLKPEASIHHMLSSVVLSLKGQYNEALIEAEKESAEWASLFAKTNVYHSLGEQQKSDSLLNILLDQFQEGGANLIAASYAWRGDNDNAFLWLEKILSENRIELLESINWVYFSKLYDDPRWANILNRLNLPNDHWILKSLENRPAPNPS